MSSHHFVREGQEPGILILNYHESLGESLGQLLEWSTGLYLTESALSNFPAELIKVDGVILRKETTSLVDTFPPPIELINAPTSRQLEVGIRHFKEKKYPGIYLFAHSDIIPQLEEWVSEHFSITLINQDGKGNRLTDIHKKWYAQGQFIRSVSNLQEYPNLIKVGMIDKMHQYEVKEEGFVKIRPAQLEDYPIWYFEA
ncbi:MAG: hypothetical protein LAT68_10695 [Cyclobacteriaceae bacterium]|nr:hypothetical protein [Cyclobacteriaceae bacterium]MCH8516784.1 hypothetical protein [Cyclobacteriaceae bacterium]